jgi:hypothetical protein
VRRTADIGLAAPRSRSKVPAQITKMLSRDDHGFVDMSAMASNAAISG